MSTRAAIAVAVLVAATGCGLYLERGASACVLLCDSTGTAADNDARSSIVDEAASAPPRRRFWGAP